MEYEFKEEEGWGALVIFYFKWPFILPFFRKIFLFLLVKFGVVTFTVFRPTKIFPDPEKSFEIGRILSCTDPVYFNLAKRSQNNTIQPNEIIILNARVTS